MSKSVSGVTLSTWGTHEGAGNGLGTYFDAKFFGGNVGHASLAVTFPANEQTKEWIRQYCLDPDIPYELKKVVTHKATLDANGKQHKTNDILHEEDVYVVYFSWFPGRKAGDKYSFSENLNSDGLNERTGVNVNWDPKFKEYVQPEERIHRGKLGQQKMTYAATAIAHEGNLTADEKQLLKLSTDQLLVARENNTLNILMDALKESDQTLQKLAERERHLSHKDERISEHNAKLLILSKLKNDLRANSPAMDNYSPKQKETLENVLGENFTSLKDLSSDQRKDLLQKLTQAHATESAALAAFKKDTPEKIAIERQKASTISENAQLSLDRFIPTWREQIKMPAGDVVNAAQHQQLSTILQERYEKNEQMIADIKAEKRKYNVLVNPTAFTKVKALQKQVDEKTNALRECKANIAADPLNKEHHKTSLLLNKEITALESEIAVIKKSDDYQFDYINSTVIRDWHDVEKHLEKLLDPTNNNFTNDKSTVVMSSKMIADLDMAFDHLVDKNETKARQRIQKAKTGWQANHVKTDLEFRKITKQEAIKLQAFVKNQIAENNKKAFELEKPTTAITSEDFAQNLTNGLLPDNTIHMSIDQQGGFAQGTENGLNVEAMLKEMQAIAASDKAFDLDTNNCSVTVGRILEAGAKGEHLKAQFQDKALGAIGNPQMVLNNAMSYEKALDSPNDSALKKLERISPIKAAGGWCVNKLLVEKDVSLGKKVAAGAAIVPIAIAAGAVAAVKKLANPVQSLKEVTDFVKYANSRSSTGLKVGAIALASPAVAVLAVPAAIVVAREKVTDGLAFVGKKLFGKAPKKATLTDNVDLEGKDIQKGLAIEATMQSALKENVVTVTGKNLKEALNNFKAALDANPGPVVFDAKTENAVLKQLAGIKEPQKRDEAMKRYQEMAAISVARVQGLQQPILQNAATPIANAPAPVIVNQAAPAAQNNDDLVLVKPAVVKSQQQFYAVMPILGEELAKQVESYTLYQPSHNHLSEEQKQSALPRTVDPKQVAANDGYLVNQAERDFIVQAFNKDSSLKELPKGTVFPGGTLSCDAFKASDNIYIANNAVLGAGSFGTVKVVQAIDAPNPNGPVATKGFYAVKIQDVDNTSEEQTLDKMKNESAMNALFGLHLGDMEITHNVIAAHPIYALASDVPPVPAAASQSEGQHDEETAAILANAALDDAKSNQHQHVANDIPPASQEADTGTTVVNQEIQSGTTVLNNDYAAQLNNASGEVMGQGLAAALDKYQEVDPTLVEAPAVESLVDRMVARHEQTKEVALQQDVASIDMLRYLQLFEKMTAAVENVHNKGIIHRDIKAENFLYDEAKGEMRLIDFGLALPLNKPNLGTPFDECAGSPHNFSPEHFDENYKKPLSTKQDMCALGRTCALLMVKELQKCNPDAFRTDIPSPLVPMVLREQMTCEFLENFQFKNPANNPQIQVMNQMVALLNEMSSFNVDKRPEASEVKQRLQAMVQSYQQTLVANQAAQPVAPQAQPVVPPIQAAPQSQEHKNVLANLSQLDAIATRHPGTTALISYAKSNLQSAKDIDISMTQLLSELSKSTTPKDRQAFAADLVRTFDQMKKTPPAQIAALAEQTPNNSPNGNQHLPPAITSHFISTKNRTLPLLANENKAAQSRNVEANLDKLDELTKDFYVETDRKAVPRMVNYLKESLKGVPNVDATMERLLGELIADKRITSRDSNKPSFKEAVKEVFTQMKKPPKNEDSKDSVVSVRMNH